MTTKTYLGRNILPCSYVENTSKGLRWYVESIHTTGIPYGEQESKKFSSLAAAKEYIRESAAQARELAS